MNTDKGIKIEDNKATCETCGQWQYTNAKKLGKIVHSRTCTNDEAQYGKFMTAPVAAKEVSPFALLPGEDIYDRDLRLVQQGHMTQSDAMNTDY